MSLRFRTWDVTQLVEPWFYMLERPWVPYPGWHGFGHDAAHLQSPPWWWRQEDQEFQVTLRYKWSSRLAWDP